MITDEILCVLVTQNESDNNGVRQIQIGIRYPVLLSRDIDFRIRVLIRSLIQLHQNLKTNNC